MSPLAKLHKNPHGQAHTNARIHVYGHLLEAGDTLEASDVYSSSDGSWQKCPCPGTKLHAGLSVVWVRPA